MIILHFGFFYLNRIFTKKPKKATFYGYGNHVCRRKKGQCQF